MSNLNDLLRKVVQEACDKCSDMRGVLTGDIKELLSRTESKEIENDSERWVGN